MKFSFGIFFSTLTSKTSDNKLENLKTLTVEFQIYVLTILNFDGILLGQLVLNMSIDNQN